MMYPDEMLEKCRFEAQGAVTIRGERIPYTAISEDNYIYGSDGKPAGSMFTYSYFRNDIADPSTRPVLFAFNGGPGSSCLWLHLGIIGPKRLKLDDEVHLPTTPPFTLEENPNCLLDMCDLVLIDPVGCGFGRLLNEEQKGMFFSTHGDIRALGIVIDSWMTRYGRHNSPILLAGESYGTCRSALLVGELNGAGPLDSQRLGIPVNGIMLLGSIFFDPIPAETSVLNMLTMAATHHYHRPNGKPARDQFLRQAEAFAAGEYLTALYQGDALCGAERQKIIERICYFTGMKEKYVRDHRLRIDMREFMHLLLEEEGKIVGFYDGRYTWPEDKTIPEFDVIADDPAMGQYTPAFHAGISLLKKELGITFDRSSYGLSQTVNKSWDRKIDQSPTASLAAAMRRNPQMRVFFASGLYDLCTTAGNAHYLATHSSLDQSRVKVADYPSGHMAYLGEESARLLGEDMREFFSAALHR